MSQFLSIEQWISTWMLEKVRIYLFFFKSPSETICERWLVVSYRSLCLITREFREKSTRNWPPQKWGIWPRHTPWRPVAKKTQTSSNKIKRKIFPVIIFITQTKMSRWIIWMSTLVSVSQLFSGCFRFLFQYKNVFIWYP